MYEMEVRQGRARRGAHASIRSMCQCPAECGIPRRSRMDETCWTGGGMSPLRHRCSVKCPSPAGGPRAPAGRDGHSHAMNPRFLCRARHGYDTVCFTAACRCSLQWGSCWEGESTLRTPGSGTKSKGLSSIPSSALQPGATMSPAQQYFLLP